MPALMPEQAMQVHIQLTERLLNLLHSANLCAIQLWCSPSSDFPFFQHQAQQYGLTLHQQSGGELGARMQTAFQEGLQEFKQVLLVGCDCPSLTVDDFKEAIVALKQSTDVVLAPAEDGGYVLIGVKQAQPALLNDEGMTWGSSGVLTTTRQRIEQQQLNCHEIRQQWDVDTPKDFFRYLAEFQI
jgi:rSAM/selenodomain-associated transferase 1